METSSQTSAGKWEGKTKYPSERKSTNYPIYRITQLTSFDKKKASLSPVSYHTDHFFTTQSSFLQFLREHHWPEYHTPQVQLELNGEWQFIDPRTAMQMYESYKYGELDIKQADLESDNMLVQRYVNEHDTIKNHELSLKDSFRYMWEIDNLLSVRYSYLFSLITQSEFVRYYCIRCDNPLDSSSV